MAATPPPLAVQVWPQATAQAVAQLRSARGLAVIGVVTEAGADRTVARQRIRTALRETIGLYQGQPPASIDLVSRPGEPMRVAALPLQVSVSHAPGLSVAVIGRACAVGIDLLQPALELSSMDDGLAVARDYLGPAAVAALQEAPAVRRPAVFAQLWAQQEARLKCLGLALTEWTPALERQLACCMLTPLALPAPYGGAVASRPA